MDILKRIETDLRIQRGLLRKVSKSRAVCLVTESWLKGVYNQRVPSTDSGVWHSLSDLEAQLLLAPSNIKVNRPWIRVSIKVIPRSNAMVQSLVEQPLCPVSEGQTLVELLASVHRHNFCNLWQEATRKFPAANIPHGHSNIKPNNKRVYDDLVRQVVTQMFHCKITRISNGQSRDTSKSSCENVSSEKTPHKTHPNLCEAFAIIESDSAFYIIQPYSWYNLHDCVTFSPAKLAGSYAKPLFVVYQILQGMQHSHQAGVAVGDIRLGDVLIDDRLWVKLTYPPLHKTYRKLNKRQTRTDEEQGFHLQNQSVTFNTAKTKDICSTLTGYHLDNLPTLVQRWVKGDISNFDYLMVLNNLAGRKLGDPNNHPVLPWVIDFSGPNSGFRDLSKSKFRLNKGDRQLDLTYDTSSPFPGEGATGAYNPQIPHHISDVLSDITYYVYKARQTPKSVLCAHVRSKWVPNEYPSSMQRLQEWTPDECIPEFFTDPTIFSSIHKDLPDLEVPLWCCGPVDFVQKHMNILEGEYVSQRLHHWIDLTFGYKLSGNAAVKSKNVCLQLVDQHTDLTNHGVVQLFNQPHPPRMVRSIVATRTPPRFRRPSIHPQISEENMEKESTKRDGTLEKKSKQSDGSTDQKVAPRAEEAAVTLPLGYDPLALLEQIESLYSFSSKAAHQLPPQGGVKDVEEDLSEALISRDMQALGCLLVEVFLSARLRVLSEDASLLDRYSAIRKVCTRSMEELPRPVRSAVRRLLQLDKPWHHPETGSEQSPDSPLFQYDVISARGLPPPNPALLLNAHTKELPFPAYFQPLYDLLWKLKVTETEITHLQLSEQSQTDRVARLRQVSKDRVIMVSRFLSRMATSLGMEGLELLIPYIKSLFEDPMTSIQAAWTLFNPISQALGPRETARQFLQLLTQLFDAEQTTAKHMKLYHRTFIIQLLVRLGIETFMNNFSTLLIEACAGYKNFSGDDLDRQASYEEDFFDLAPELEYPEVFIEAPNQAESGSESGRERLPTLDLDPISNESSSMRRNVTSVSMGEEVFPDDMSLDGNDDLKQQGYTDNPSSDSGSGELPGEDRTDSQSVTGIEIGNPPDVYGDTASLSSMDVSEDILGRSIGRLSVHSVSRLMYQDQDKPGRDSSDNSADEDSQSKGRRGSSASQPDTSKEEELTNGQKSEGVTLSSSLVRSETGEFTSSIIESVSNVEYNINDVAAETIKWLSHRLGPVLTAKYMSRNLLRMLALCYYGDEQLEFITRDEMKFKRRGTNRLLLFIGENLSTTKKNVIGDIHSSNVLDCLSCIAILYGQQIILLQYFPHVREIISAAQKRLTPRIEAGLIGCVVLLTHIIPFLSDTTLMDILQDMIFKDFLLPLLHLVSSVSINFPSGSRARQVLCHKVIDTLYIISLRIGFEMTRQHMTIVLQKFFAAFSKVYDEKTLQPRVKTESTSSTKTPVNNGTTEMTNDSQYCEIKMDLDSREYKVGPAMPPASTDAAPKSHGHQRQGSGTFKYSLSPPSQEDKNEEAESSEGKQTDREMVSQELRETFTPELAHIAYIPFCKLAGGIHMEQNLINDDLIRQLCAAHDEAVARQQVIANMTLNKDSLGGSINDSSSSTVNSSGNRTKSGTEEDKDVVSGSFGCSVSVTGNKIMIAEDEGQTIELPKEGATKTRRRSGEPPIDYNKLRSPEMEINKQRHVKGNWLAYWEHELGLSDRETSFNFKQIKLQTFAGHSNSVRSIYVMDNENSFLSASKDKTVKLWSLRSFGDGTGRVGCQGSYSYHKKSVFAVTFLEAPRVAASCDSVVHIWDPFVGMCIRQFESPRSVPVTVLTPMPAPHSTLLSATTEATLRFLDVRAGSYTHEFKCTTGPAGLIRCAGVSPDGHWVAVGYSSGVISLLDIRTGVLFASWKGHEGEILQIKAYNNKSLVTSSFDQCMGLWNVEDAKLVCHLKGPTEPVHCFSFYRNEIVSATTGNRVGVHTSIDRQASFSSTKLRSDVFRGVLTTMAILPHNKLVLLGADNGNIRLLA